MIKTITLKWYTGSAIVMPEMLLRYKTAAEVQKLIKTATENAEEVKAELAAYIHSEIEMHDNKTEWGKKEIARLKKYLAVVEDRKLTKQEKAVQRIVDGADDCRPQFKGMFQSGGKYCVCDGYRAVRSSAPFYGVEEKTNDFDVSKVFGDISAYSMRLELPDLKELKADIKLAKMGKMDAGRVHYGGGHNSVVYDFGYGLPAVDAKYLVDMLEALPGCEAFCNPEKNLAPIYFVSGEDDGILLLISKHQEWEAAPVEQAAPVVEEAPAVVEPVAAVENPVPVDTADEERARRAEQERLDRERALADELAKAEQAIMNGGYIENKNIDGKCVFLRLFDAYGIKIAPRSRGWIIDKLKSVTTNKDGASTVHFRATRKGEKTSQGFRYAYYELRSHLIKLTEEAQAEAEARAREEAVAVDMSALDRVLAVAAAVYDGAHDSKAIADYLNLYGNDMITEDEAKSALLRYTVPLALPAHEEAAQATETPAAVSSVVAVHPALLAVCAWRYGSLYNARDSVPVFIGAVPDFDSASRGSPPLLDVPGERDNLAFCAVSGWIDTAALSLSVPDIAPLFCKLHKPCFHNSS